jgi:hypothetical protein
MTNAPPKPARHPAALLMQIRTVHTYVGMLIAPAVLFFACTGILQIYSLHEAHGGYTPPPVIEKLSALHKDQVFAQPRRRPPPAASAVPKPATPPPGGAAHHAKLATTLLKAVFAAVAVGLIGSTCAGLWMALRQPGRRRLYLLLLLIGAGVPLVLAALSGQVS